MASNNNTTGDIEGGGSSDVSTVRLLGERHAAFKVKVDRMNAQVQDKKRRLAQLEEEITFSLSTLATLEQNERSLSAALDRDTEELAKVDLTSSDLVKELVSARASSDLYERTYASLVDSKYVDFHVEKAIRIDKVTKEEETEDSQMDEVKEELRNYQEYKSRLEGGDPALLDILSGTSLSSLQVKMEGMKTTMAQGAARVESIYLDVDEANEAIEQKRTELTILEKQQTAKLRKLQGDLKDRKGTELHLKQTVQYLNRDVDPGLSSSTSANGKSFGVFGSHKSSK